jgi:hypothetical protein
VKTRHQFAAKSIFGGTDDAELLFIAVSDITLDMISLFKHPCINNSGPCIGA